MTATACSYLHTMNTTPYRYTLQLLRILLLLPLLGHCVLDGECVGQQTRLPLFLETGVRGSKRVSEKKGFPPLSVALLGRGFLPAPPPSLPPPLPPPFPHQKMRRSPCRSPSYLLPLSAEENRQRTRKKLLACLHAVLQEKMMKTEDKKIVGNFYNVSAKKNTQASGEQYSPISLYLSIFDIFTAKRSKKNYTTQHEEMGSAGLTDHGVKKKRKES